MREILTRLLGEEPELEIAVLIGSRATDQARSQSDWDIAVQWRDRQSLMKSMALTEGLRHRLAARLGCLPDGIDLIHIPDANLTMRSVIAEEGIPVKGEATLAWKHFLQRTWRELEEVYWEEIYAH